MLSFEQLESRDTPSVSIAVINTTTLATPEDVDATVRAIQKQVNRDVYKYWHVKAHLHFVSDMSQVRTGEEVLLIGDNFGYNPGALAWHEYDVNQYGSHPVSYVPIAINKAYHADWHISASHEVCEMLLDRKINKTVYVSSFDGVPAKLYRELCDPVEENSYKINGLHMSDFITPSYFTYNSAGGVYDFLHVLQTSLSGTAGGYQIYIDLTTNTINEVDY